MASTFHALRDIEVFESALDASKEEPILLYKHSSRCSLSAAARREVQELSEQVNTPIYELVVQEARPASDEIAARLDIRHETPQVIILEQGEPVFNASHRDITVDTIRQALPTANPS